ncbi:MAG TPA: hypothetical protein VMR62_11675, partial [Bryobacteraceae bacterium]|nr:hypothetical protein [Bryobacteraceae bacterium]
ALRVHYEEVAAASDAAAATAEELHRSDLEIADHARELEVIASAHEQESGDAQVASEPVYSVVDLQASAIYSGQFIPDGGREIVKEDVPTVKKTIGQKIQDWWDNLWR